MNGLPALSILNNELTYEPATGILRWKRGRQGRAASLVAGYESAGYRRVHISGRTYQASRIAFAMYHCRDVIGEIDHIDGDPSNNRISNLREASRLQNSRNRQCRGFSKHPHRKKNPFAARIKTEREHAYLGVFPTEEAARKAYVEATKRYFGEFSRPDLGDRQ